MIFWVNNGTKNCWLYAHQYVTSSSSHQPHHLINPTRGLQMTFKPTRELFDSFSASVTNKIKNAAWETAYLCLWIPLKIHFNKLFSVKWDICTTLILRLVLITCWLLLVGLLGWAITRLGFQIKTNPKHTWMIINEHTAYSSLTQIKVMSVCHFIKIVSEFLSLI